MKGIILAGGTGSRLSPLTIAVNKHLLPIGDKPMVLRSIEKLTEAGITEIAIVTSPEQLNNFSCLLKSGKDYNCDITYKVQDDAGGVGQALGLCEKFVGDDSCIVILGDNMFEDSLIEDVKSFKHDCKLFFKKVPDGHRYGVAVWKAIDGQPVFTLSEILEKPTNVTKADAVVGIYMYSKTVFDIIKTIKPSYRNEIEITSVNNVYVQNQNKFNLTTRVLNGWWTDAGTLESYKRANEYAHNR